jgi:integrase/recombinase XerC
MHNQSPKAGSVSGGRPATLHESFSAYLDGVALSRSANTAKTYRQAIHAFRLSVERLGVDPDQVPVASASEDWVAAFAQDLKPRAPSTERLYLTAIAGYFEYLAAEKLADVNLARMRLLIRQRARRPGQRLPQFPRSAIEQVLDGVQKPFDSADPNERLRHLRDRAFLLTLADTGLRVHEACKLRRGDIDWDEAQALMIGKGNRQAVVRFSRRSLGALKAYLAARSTLDGASGRALSALPVFARHDRGAGKRVRPITTTTGRTIVHQAVAATLGDDAVGTITPHSFRHYFVTTVLRGSGGNLKMAQELARHRNIAVTQRYAHLSDDELDRGYHDIFDAEDE